MINETSTRSSLKVNLPSAPHITRDRRESGGENASSHPRLSSRSRGYDRKYTTCNKAEALRQVLVGKIEKPDIYSPTPSLSSSENTSETSSDCPETYFQRNRLVIIYKGKHLKTESYQKLKHSRHSTCAKKQFGSRNKTEPWIFSADQQHGRCNDDHFENRSKRHNFSLKIQGKHINPTLTSGNTNAKREKHVNEHDRKFLTKIFKRNRSATYSTYYEHVAKDLPSGIKNKRSQRKVKNGKPRVRKGLTNPQCFRSLDISGSSCASRNDGQAHGHAKRISPTVSIFVNPKTGLHPNQQTNRRNNYISSIMSPVTGNPSTDYDFSTFPDTEGTCQLLEEMKSKYGEQKKRYEETRQRMEHFKSELGKRSDFGQSRSSYLVPCFHSPHKK